MNITSKLFSLGALLTASLSGSIISSADPAIFLDTELPVVIVQSPPQSHAPFIYPPGFTYISNQQSGFGGSNLNEPVGMAFLAYEPFSVVGDSILSLTGFGDDTAHFSYIRDTDLAEQQLGDGTFRVPLVVNAPITAGDYLLIVQVFNNQTWPNNNAGNYTAAGWNGSIVTATPEPGTWIMLLTGAGMLAVSRIRRRNT